jgi:DNA polymerase elongation subunit (family B)
VTTTAFLNAQLIDNRITLLYRDEAGVLKQKSVAPEWISYHPAKVEDTPTAPIFAKHRDVLGVKQEGDYIRVRWRGKWERRDSCKKLRESGKIPVLEGDLNPIKRLIADKGLGIAKPRRLYFDIETDSRANFAKARQGESRVLSWAAIDEDGNEFTDVLEEWSDEAEKRLLLAFWKLAEKYDQLIAWAGRHGTDTYDFVVMEQRSKRMGASPKDYGRWLWLDHHDVFERMNKNAAESGAEKQSLKLQDVGMELLGWGKDEFAGNRTYEAWLDNGSYKSRAELIKYNLQDVRVMVGIEEKSGYIGVFQALCEACSIFPSTYSLFPTVQMDGFMLRLGAERNMHFATKWYDKEEDDFVKEQFEGAYVLHPTRSGIVEDVHVGDFASMYPSMIISWNMSPETKLGYFTPENQPPNSCRCPATGVCFSNVTQGILAFAVAEMLRLRKFWKDKQASFPPGTPEAVDASRRSMAYKVAANSFYGAMGNKYARYFDKAIAESVSTTGGWLIQNTIEQGATERWGIEAIAGDTDSTFVVGTTREHFVEFVDWCNKEFYPKLIASVGVKVNKISFDNEKGYKRIVFLKKNDGTPASKKYVGVFSYYKGMAADENSKPEIKGIEWRRGDANAMARNMQWDIVQIFCKPHYQQLDLYTALVDKWKHHILEEPLSFDEVKISQSVTKPLDDYVQKVKKDGGLSAQPAHVRIAHLLKERGAEIGEGTRVEYFVKDNVNKIVLPAEDYDGECDRFYLWEQKVYSSAQRLLEAIHPGHDWKSIKKVRPKKERVIKQKAVTPIRRIRRVTAA